MNNHIYLADNPNQDMFNVTIPAFDTGTEIPAPPVKEEHSEMNYLAEKSFISFGIMAVCIVLILIFALIIKKNKNKKDDFIQEEIVHNEQPEQEKTITEHQLQPAKIKRSKISELATPATISKCIKSFLENTKEN